MTVSAAPVESLPRGRWRRPSPRRVLVVGLAVLGVIVLGLLSMGSSDGGRPLDPDGTSPDGSRAVVEVLRAHGIRVEVARSIDDLERALAEGDPASTTVAVGESTLIGPDHADRLVEATLHARRVVLLDTTPQFLDALPLPLTATEGQIAARRAPECTGPVPLGLVPEDSSIIHLRYALTVDEKRLEGAVPPGLCFPVGSGFALAAFPGDEGVWPEMVALGATSIATNDRVDDAGHAALVLHLLGPSPRLVWYQPSVGDVDVSLDSSTGIPPWFRPGLWLLAVAVGVLALIRGRRLGPLVPERLPVVVPASEPTVARARLYQRGSARDRAAAALRIGTLGRLRRRLALPPGAPVEQVIAAASGRSGLPDVEVADLLAGPPPTTDPDLATLARRLADLEERVRDR